MKNETLQIAAIAAAVIVAGGAILAIRSWTTPEPTTVETTPTTTTATDGSVPSAQDTIIESIGDEEFNPYPTSETKTDAETVVQTFGCGWWAQPIQSETTTELADRLKPLLTNQMHEAITKLRTTTTADGTTIEATPGAIEKLSSSPTEEHYKISCNTLKIDDENKPIGTSKPRESEVWLTPTPKGFIVSKAKLGGLTLP